MLNYCTAGESHGKALVALIEGVPAGVPVPEAAVADFLARRRRAGGRSTRMAVENDAFEIIAGVRDGVSTGAPIAIIVKNRDYRPTPEPLQIPRPGHADLAGMFKYDTDNARDIAERASARETAARCVAGAVAASMLKALGIEAFGHVVAIGTIRLAPRRLTLAQALHVRSRSQFYTVHPERDDAITRETERAAKKGDSLGGVFEVKIIGAPAGLGCCMRAADRLDARLAAAMMSIPAVKGVEIGDGFVLASRRGSEAHDEIILKGGVITRLTNRAGGIEGGMTNGEMIIVRAAVKPIPTLANPLRSVDMRAMKPARAPVVRADICAAPAASVVGEAAAAFEIARAVTERFGGDTLPRIRAAMQRPF